MISVSNNFKTEITKPRTIDGKVIVGNRTLTSSQVNYIRRVFNTSLFKTILKQVEIDSNEPIDKGETVNPQFGLLINDSFEYVSLGSYKAKNEPILNKDTNSYQISSCDKIVESMVSYALTTSDITYPCTVRQLFVAIFTKLGWSTSGIPSTFTNSTSIIEEDVYSNVNFTYRDVLDELCTISCMFLVDKGNPTLIQKTTTNETINEQFMKSTNVAVKERVFFNSLVFSRAEGSDNIYRKDDTSIATNGLHEFKVSDLQILSLNWRDNFINAMWNYIKTFEYYSYEIDTYGIIYLEPVDLFTISTFGDTYNTILLNSDLIIGNGVSEKIYADTPKETTTEYQYATDTDRKMNQTYLIVDKQQGQINAVVSQVDEIEQDLSSPTNTLTGQYFDIGNALDEPLVDFSMEGQTEQDSTTGKNLFNINSNATTLGIEYSFNGSELSLNGTTTNAGNIYNNNNNTILLKSGTYTFSTTTSGTFTRNGKDVAIYLRKKSDSSTIAVFYSTQQYTTTKTFTLNEDTELYMQLYTNGSGFVFNNFKINLMLEKGSTATKYEEYTGGNPAPNPDYPQDIHCVSGDNTINICGKNLFDKDNATLSNKYISFDGSVVGASDWVCVENYLEIKPNTTYIASMKNMGARFIWCEYNSSQQTIGTRQENTTGIMTTSSTAKYIRFCTNNNTATDIQLELGSSASQYEAYTGNSQLISLGVENKFSGSMYNAAFGTGGSIVSSAVRICNVDVGGTSSLLLTKGTYTLDIPNLDYCTAMTKNAGGTILQDFTSQWNNLPFTFTLTQDGYFYFVSRKSDNSNLTPSDYSPKITIGNHIQYISSNPIELCKIGDYQDYIYKDNGKWYLHKEIGKVVLDGTQAITKATSVRPTFYPDTTLFTNKVSGADNFFCDNFAYLGNAQTTDLGYAMSFNTGQYSMYCYMQFPPDVISIEDTLEVQKFLRTHNTQVYYPLKEASQTDTEITGTLLEQLNRLMTLPLYKEMTHITIEPNDLTPIMNIEYVRDTAINSQFVRQPQLNNYYTRTETTAQIQIGNASIKSDVTEIQTTLNNNGNAIGSLSRQVQTLQSSTSLQINAINKTLEDGVEKLNNSLVTIDINGINTSKDNETFNTQITNKTFEVKDGDNRMGFMGFDTDKQKMLVEFPEMQTKRLTNAYHTTEKITEDGLKWSADFYVGDDN